MPDMSYRQDQNQSSMDDANSCNPAYYTREERNEAQHVSDLQAARNDKPIQDDPWGNAVAGGAVSGPIGIARGAVAGATAEAMVGEVAKEAAFEVGKTTMEVATDVPSAGERAEAAEAAEAQRRNEAGMNADNTNSCQEPAPEQCGDYYDPDRNSSQPDQEEDQE